MLPFLELAHMVDIDVHVGIGHVCIYTINFFNVLDIDDDQVTNTSRNNPKSLDCQTFQFFLMFKFTAPANELWDQTKITGANNIFEHLDYRWLTTKFKKSSFSHTVDTFLESINIWMMKSASINTRTKKNGPRRTPFRRKWLPEKRTFRHSEITIF